VALAESENSAQKEQFPGLWEWAGFVAYEEAPQEAFELAVYDFFAKDPVSRLPKSAKDWDPLGEDVIDDFSEYIGDPAVLEKAQWAVIQLIAQLRHRLLLNRFSN